MKKSHKSMPLFSIQCYEDRHHPLPLKKLEDTSLEVVNNKEQQRSDVTSNAPPPPPMPFKNGDYKIDLPNLNSEEILLNKNNLRKVGTLTRTPTPDYNSKLNPVMEIKLKSNGHENAEVESLESYKLKNPLSVQPKPPPNYFVKAPNGTATMKKNVRPVSVTIGEYVNNVGNRREPSKMEFLNGDKTDGRRIGDDEPISSRLQSELALTLSRSNLRKKTEALDHVFHKISVTKSIHKDDVFFNNDIFYTRYGNNLLPLPPSITIPKADAGR